MSAKPRNSRFILCLTSILLLLIVGFLRILPQSYLVIVTFLMVLFFSSILEDRQSIKFIFVLFVLNAIQRRVLAGDSFYIANDPLILLPYIPMIFLVLRHLRTAFSGGVMNLVFALTLLTLFSVSSDPVQVGWGFLNLSLSLLVARISYEFFNTDLLLKMFLTGL